MSDGRMRGFARGWLRSCQFGLVEDEGSAERLLSTREDGLRDWLRGRWLCVFYCIYSSLFCMLAVRRQYVRMVSVYASACSPFSRSRMG